MNTKVTHHFRNGERIERRETTHADGSRTIIDRKASGQGDTVLREIEISKQGISTIKLWK